MRSYSAIKELELLKLMSYSMTITHWHEVIWSLTQKTPSLDRVDKNILVIGVFDMKSQRITLCFDRYPQQDK